MSQQYPIELANIIIDYAYPTICHLLRANNDDLTIEWPIPDTAPWNYHPSVPNMLFNYGEHQINSIYLSEDIIMTSKKKYTTIKIGDGFINFYDIILIKQNFVIKTNLILPIWKMKHSNTSGFTIETPQTFFIFRNKFDIFTNNSTNNLVYIKDIPKYKFTIDTNKKDLSLWYKGTEKNIITISDKFVITYNTLQFDVTNNMVIIENFSFCFIYNSYTYSEKLKNRYHIKNKYCKDDKYIIEVDTFTIII